MSEVVNMLVGDDDDLWIQPCETKDELMRLFKSPRKFVRSIKKKNGESFDLHESGHFVITFDRSPVPFVTGAPGEAMPFIVQGIDKTALINVKVNPNKNHPLERGLATIKQHIEDEKREKMSQLNMIRARVEKESPDKFKELSELPRRDMLDELQALAAPPETAGLRSANARELSRKAFRLNLYSDTDQTPALREDRPDGEVVENGIAFLHFELPDDAEANADFVFKMALGQEDISGQLFQMFEDDVFGLVTEVVHANKTGPTKLALSNRDVVSTPPPGMLRVTTPVPGRFVYEGVENEDGEACRACSLIAGQYTMQGPNGLVYVYDATDHFVKAYCPSGPGTNNLVDEEVADTKSNGGPVVVPV